jgi:hypothetical protein
VRIPDLIAVVSATVALCAMVATILVGRWQLRGALAQASAARDAASATNATAHAVWRRGVQRDAYVAFLVAVAEVENVQHPIDEAAADSAQAAVAASEEALRRARTAFYVLRLESRGIAEPAGELLTAVTRAQHAVRRYTRYLRAWSTMRRCEVDAGSGQGEHREALERLEEIAGRPDAGSVEGARRLRAASGSATHALAQLGVPRDQVRVLVSAHVNPSDVSGKQAAVHAARRAFLAAAREQLDVSEDEFWGAPEGGAMRAEP